MKKELEELLRQKKEIERKIRLMENGWACETEWMLFKINENEEKMKYQISAKGIYQRRRYGKGSYRNELIEDITADRWYPFIREESPRKAIEQLEKIGKEIPIMIEKIKNMMEELEEEAKAKRKKNGGEFFIKRKDGDEYVTDYSENAVVFTKNFAEALKYRNKSEAEAARANMQGETELVICCAI